MQSSAAAAAAAWRLEIKGAFQRLLITLAGVTETPEVELSGDAVRFRGGATACGAWTSLPLPAEAAGQVDPLTARCAFSRKRCELLVEWPTKTQTVQQEPQKAEKENVEKKQAQVPQEPGPGGDDDQETQNRHVGPQEEEISPEAPQQEQPTPDDEERPKGEEQSADGSGSHGESQGQCQREGGWPQETQQTPTAETSQATAEADASDNAASLPSEAFRQSRISADEWRLRGNEAVKAGNFEEAASCYSQGLALAASEGLGAVAVLHCNRAHCLLRLDRYESAWEDASRCVAMKPDFVKGYLRGASALRALGRPEEALTFLKRCPAHGEAGALAAELKPEAEAAQRARLEALGSGAERAKEEGNVLFRKGLFEEARAKYSEAVALCEDHEGPLALAARNNRAACAHQLSDYGAVVEDSSFVLAREPNNFKALVRRMLALEPLERCGPALEDARAVLRLDPRHEVANKVQHRLGKLVRDQQRSGA